MGIDIYIYIYAPMIKYTYIIVNKYIYIYVYMYAYVCLYRAECEVHPTRRKIVGITQEYSKYDWDYCGNHP